MPVLVARSLVDSEQLLPTKNQRQELPKGSKDKQIPMQLRQQQDLSIHHFSHEADALHKHIRGRAVQQSFVSVHTLCLQPLHERCVPICIMFNSRHLLGL